MFNDHKKHQTNIDPTDLDTPIFEDEEDKELYGIAMVGESTADFLATDTGQFLIGAAKQDLQEIQRKLLDTPAYRKRKIQSLQVEAKAIRRMLAYIDEAMALAEHARQALHMKEQARNE